MIPSPHSVTTLPASSMMIDDNPGVYFPETGTWPHSVTLSNSIKRKRKYDAGKKASGEILKADKSSYNRGGTLSTSPDVPLDQVKLIHPGTDKRFELHKVHLDRFKQFLQKGLDTVRSPEISWNGDPALSPLYRYLSECVSCLRTTKKNPRAYGSKKYSGKSVKLRDLLEKTSLCCFDRQHSVRDGFRHDSRAEGIRCFFSLLGIEDDRDLEDEEYVSDGPVTIEQSSQSHLETMSSRPPAETPRLVIDAIHTGVESLDLKTQKRHVKVTHILTAELEPYGDKCVGGERYVPETEIEMSNARVARGIADAVVKLMIARRKFGTRNATFVANTKFSRLLALSPRRFLIEFGPDTNSDCDLQAGNIIDTGLSFRDEVNSPIPMFISALLKTNKSLYSRLPWNLMPHVVDTPMNEYPGFDDAAYNLFVQALIEGYSPTDEESQRQLQNHLSAMSSGRFAHILDT